MVLSPEPNDWQENRRKRLLGQLDWLSTRGVEIGPLASPLARRPEADVRYVDLVETDELKQKYALDPNVITEDIVGVDAVWGECSLAECFSDEEDFDWVIASHVVEHVPDLIGWLADISNILRSGGRLYLAVPDYRVTFDRFRSTSSLAEIVAAHLNGAKQPSLAQIFSQTLYFSNLTSNQVWQSAPDPAEHLSLEQLQRAWDTTAYAAKTGDNVDLHCWVFTPRSWFETLIALSELGLLSYRCVEFSPTAPGENEFFVVLEKLGSEEAVQNNLAGDEFRQRLKSLEDATSPAERGLMRSFWVTCLHRSVTDWSLWYQPRIRVIRKRSVSGAQKYRRTIEWFLFPTGWHLRLKYQPPQPSVLSFLRISPSMLVMTLL